MRESMPRPRALVFVCAVSLLGASSDTAPLTLADALAASAGLSTTRAAAALSDARDAAARVRDAPRTSVVTSFTSQPQSGTPPQYQGALEYALDFGSTARRLGALAAANAQLDQSSAALETTRRTTTRATIAAFFALIAAQAQADADVGAEALAARTLAVARTRARAGVTPSLDVDRADAADAVARSNVAASAAALDGARTILRALVPDRAFETAAPPDVDDALPAPEAVSASALAGSPDVSAAQGALRASEATAAIARGETSPALTLALGPGISRTGNVQTIGPAATIALDVPLASPLLRSNASAAAAAVLVARSALDQTRRAAVGAALGARADTASAVARLPMLHVAMLATAHVADADLAAYRLGAVSIVDLIGAQALAGSASAAFATARAQAAERSATLHLEMGDFSR